MAEEPFCAYISSCGEGHDRIRQGTMINISKLYCDQITPGDWLRYGSKGSGERRAKPSPRRHRREGPSSCGTSRARAICNASTATTTAGRTSPATSSPTDKAKAVIDDLAGFGVPSILFSGGEPLMRHDLFELIAYAVGKGLRTVISTNGTLIDEDKAREIKRLGVSYVGISLDGIGPINDKFRGVPGAFERAVQGIRNCQDAGVRVGLRLTLTKRNAQDMEGLFDFFEAEGIERACFYHLVPSGRGRRSPARI